MCYNTNIFFNKFESSAYNLILTWETDHNGNRALYGSHINIFLDNIETIKKEDQIKLSAAPIHSHLIQILAYTPFTSVFDLLIYDITWQLMLSTKLKPMNME